MGELSWPDGKRFAFTIVDDTDFSSVSNTRPVYEFLDDLGIRTTKTAWPLRPQGRGLTGGRTLQDPEYRHWILDLQRRGFEIALHGVADGTSDRSRVAAGLDFFRTVLGHAPSLHTNHAAQGEGIYWGPRRLDGPLRWFYHAYRRWRTSLRYEGGAPASPYFWGDLCHNTIKYVRNFVFNDINTAAADPLMPYHDPRRPHVRHWFSAANGATVEAFCRLISEANQERLLGEGGACIVYTHLGNGFHPLPAEFRRLMRHLSRMPGWFVPATRLLDSIGDQRGWRTISDRAELRRMQWRWALERSAHTLRRCTPRASTPRPKHSPEPQADY